MTERIKEHQQLVAEVARLQAELDRDRPAALAALPAAYGYRDMDSFIQAVTQACGQPQRRKKVARTPRAKISVKPKAADVEIGIGMAKATEAAPAPAESPRPSGTSLDDPKAFGLLPDLSLLETTGGDSRIQQAKLADALKFAQQVLHTSGVPAATWREWRQFEHKASNVLRTLNTVVHPKEE
ncbi:MAG: hypothetical protein ABII82_09335 [Verrucomicrobiota bacterium]